MASTVRLNHLPYGDFGSMTTLQHMRRLVDGGLRSPLVVETAHYVVRNCAPRDYVAMALAIRDWMASAFRFVPDPLGVELTREPVYMLRQYQQRNMVSGDCDDAAILSCALAKAVGIPCKFVAIGFRANGNLGHVYGVAYPPGRAINGKQVCVSFDVTRPIGKVAQVRRRMEVRV